MWWRFFLLIINGRCGGDWGRFLAFRFRWVYLYRQAFSEIFRGFYAKYGFCNMYSGGFYPFARLEEHWAY